MLDCTGVSPTLVFMLHLFWGGLIAPSMLENVSSGFSVDMGGGMSNRLEDGVGVVVSSVAAWSYLSCFHVEIRNCDV